MNEVKRLAKLEVAETRGKEHGRLVQRRLQVTTRLAGQLDWPGLQQVCRLVRTTRRNGQVRDEIEYAVTSVPRQQANARQLLTWWRDHWGIENRSHYVRDVTFDEDACRIRSGHAPQNFAALRNAAIAWLRLHGYHNIAAGLRACTWQTDRLFAMLGIMKN